MSSQTMVRPFAESDLDWLVENEYELHAFPWTRQNFTDALEAGYTTRIMCIEASRAAYAVMLHVLDEVHLLNLSVTRPLHCRGIGSDFLRRLEVEARDVGATQFFLEVRPSNEGALTLYRNHGFVSIGRRARYYPSHDGLREDAIVMRLAL